MSKPNYAYTTEAEVMRAIDSALVARTLSGQLHKPIENIPAFREHAHRRMKLKHMGQHRHYSSHHDDWGNARPGGIYDTFDLYAVVHTARQLVVSGAVAEFLRETPV